MLYIGKLGALAPKRQPDCMRPRMQTPQTTVMSPTAAAIPSLDALYADYVNPEWVNLLNILQINAQYKRCRRAALSAADGRRILDFLSGYCVHNSGPNQPTTIAALIEELERSGPAML